MAIYEVFSHPIVTRYKTSICTKATVFYVIVTLATFISPLVITYCSQGFWKKISYYREKPDVSFKHKLLLLLETKLPQEIVFWSTFAKLNSLVTKNLQKVVPSIEHIEEDLNRDGKKDEMHMKIEIPLSSQAIMSVKAILIFDYKLQTYSQFQMECAAYIHYNSAFPGASLSVVGELLLQQRKPLRHTGADKEYNVPVIDESKSDLNSYKLETIFQQYMRRNVTAMFQNSYPIWKAGRAAKEPFVIDLVISYPEQTILYRVGFWQLLKWGLVQYIAVFAIVSWLMYYIKLWFFQRQLVPTLVISPLKREL